MLGLFLENYIPPDLNTTIEVLEGQILVEILGLQKNITLNVGQNLTVPSGDYHNVHTISSTPSCYMYVYLNQSDVEIVKLWDKYYNLTFRDFTYMYLLTIHIVSRYFTCHPRHTRL